MAKSPKQTVTLEAIRSALRSAAEDFLSRVATEHPAETLYAFVFETDVEGFSAHGAVATEQALTRFAQREVKKGRGKDLEKVRAEFRWGSTEDGWYQDPDAAFDQVNALLTLAARQELYELFDGTLQSLCIEVLKELDAAGTFGASPGRERVILGVCYIGGDNSDEEFLNWAKQVNPPTAYKRLQKELRNRDL